MVFPEPCAGTYGAPPLLVPAPAILPWRFGLLSVASVIDETDEHARNGIRYKSPRCTGYVAPWVDDCDSAEVEAKSPTDVSTEEIPFDPYVQGCPFHLYAALSCKQTNLAAMGAEVAEVFEWDQQRAVENQVWLNVVAPDAVVINDSSGEEDALSLVCAIGSLESAIAACYGGRATFHMPRILGSSAAQFRQVHTEANAKFTELGSAVAFYGGSPNTDPDGVEAPDGFAWIYATSDVVLRRFPIDVLPDESDQRLRYDPLTNEPYVLAERTYVASVECCKFAALVAICE